MTHGQQTGATQEPRDSDGPTDGMVHVVAELSFAPELREEFLAAFRWLEPLVCAETGCIEYRGTLEVRAAVPAQAPPRTGVLMVIEKWASEDALAAHLRAPHMSEFASRTTDSLTDRVIRVTRDIGAAG